MKRLHLLLGLIAVPCLFFSLVWLKENPTSGASLLPARESLTLALGGRYANGRRMLYPLEGTYELSWRNWLWEGSEHYAHSQHRITLMNQPLEDQRHILMEKFHVDTSSEPHWHEDDHEIAIRMREMEGTEEEEEMPFFVHFKAPIHHTTVEEVADIAGVAFTRYYPQNTYLVMMLPSRARAVGEHNGVKWVGVYKPEYKISPTVHQVEDALEIVRDAGGWKAVPQDPIHAEAVRIIDEVHDHEMAVLLLESEKERPTTESVEALIERDWAPVWPDIHFDVTRPTRVYVEGIPHEIHGEFAEWVSNLKYVQAVETRPLIYGFNVYSRYTIQGHLVGTVGDRTGTTPIWDMGIHGEGQVAAMGDSGLDQNHCQFEGKVLAYRSSADQTDDAGGHGTHCAGSVLGKSEVEKYNGAAYEADITVYDIGINNQAGLRPPNDLASQNPGGGPAYYPTSFADGARVHTNSWGGGNAGSYNTYSQDNDEYMIQNPEFLILFAAGNDGRSGPGTVSPPSTGKNNFAIAAATSAHENWIDACNNVPGCPQGGNANTQSLNNDYNGMADFSSRGSSGDNRMAPQISAPGRHIQSADSLTTCAFRNMAGTSMATPTAAGASILVRQWLTDGFYPGGEKGGGEAVQEPEASLIKALMINSAEMMDGTVGGSPIPRQGQYNEHYGFGALRLGNALFSKESTFGTEILSPRVNWPNEDPTAASVSTNGESEICITTDGSSRVAATLVWTDPPGQTNAAGGLVNNLDLVLTGPDGAVIGNAISQFTNGGADSDSNHEKAEVANPVAGEYCAKVVGTNVPQGPQDFSLVITGGGDNVGRKGGGALGSLAGIFGIQSVFLSILVWIALVLAILAIIAGVAFYVIASRDLDAQAAAGGYTPVGRYGAYGSKNSRSTSRNHSRSGHSRNHSRSGHSRSRTSKGSKRSKNSVGAFTQQTSRTRSKGGSDFNSKTSKGSKRKQSDPYSSRKSKESKGSRKKSTTSRTSKGSKRKMSTQRKGSTGSKNRKNKTSRAKR